LDRSPSSFPHRSFSSLVQVDLIDNPLWYQDSSTLGVLNVPGLVA
jgi:hypothetical protein